MAGLPYADKKLGLPFCRSGSPVYAVVPLGSGIAAEKFNFGATFLMSKVGHRNLAFG